MRPVRHAPTGTAGPIGRVGVVGCGIMGSGIAEVCARSGVDVLVAVSSPASLTAGRERVAKSLENALRKGRIGEAERDTARAAISFTADLADLADRHMVVEAVAEDEAEKTAIFGALDKIVTSPDALLASNTSSIPIIRLARATERPEQVLGTHFFNPATAMPLVELVTSLLTGAQARNTAEDFITQVLGKRIVHSPDRSGFVINYLLIPYLLSAIRMVESGFADTETVDTAMKLGCSHPMGPLQLADLIGLDTVAAIAHALHEEFREPSYAPPPLLRRMVEAGQLGRKSGQGFRTYP